MDSNVIEMQPLELGADIFKGIEKPLALTDLGNAERLIRDYGKDLLFNHPAKTWYVWNGRVWEEDRRGLVKAYAAKVVRKISTEIPRNSEQYELFRGWEIQSESGVRLAAMVTLAQAKVPIVPEDFDKPMQLFNVENGTLNLETLELQPHSRADYLTKMAPVTYNPDAACPKWQKFLAEVMGETFGMADFMQKLFGYALGATNELQLIFLFHGVGGNGKTVCVEIALELFGPYGIKAQFDTFLDLKKSAGQARGDLARLVAKRLVVATESEEKAKLNMGVLKELTGGDTFTARHLYQSEIEFRPYFSLWLVSNWKPEIAGQENATWRRLKLVPFTVVIPEANQNPKLPDTLKKEELSGILNWAIEGLAAYRKNGIKLPVAVEMATAEYRDSEDKISQFIEANGLVKNPHAKINRSKVYSLYLAWLAKIGSPDKPSAHTLFQMFSLFGFTQAKTAKERFIVGLGFPACG